MHTSSEERTLAAVTHLAPVLGYAIGFGQILIPLLILLWKGKESEFVREHALESLNFQISVFIYGLIAGLLMLVLIGFVLMGVLGLFALVAMILATLKASNGEFYRYPLCLRLVK